MQGEHRNRGEQQQIMTMLQGYIEEAYLKQKLVLRQLLEKQQKFEDEKEGCKKGYESVKCNLQSLKELFVGFKSECESEWMTVNQQILSILNQVVTIYQLKVSNLENKLIQEKRKNCQLQEQCQQLQQKLFKNNQTELNHENRLEDKLPMSNLLIQNVEKDSKKKVKISDVIATYQSISKKDDEGFPQDFQFDSRVDELFHIDCPNLFEVNSAVINRQENGDQEGKIKINKNLQRCGLAVKMDNYNLNQQFIRSPKYYPNTFGNKENTITNELKSNNKQIKSNEYYGSSERAKQGDASTRRKSRQQAQSLMPMSGSKMQQLRRSLFTRRGSKKLS